MNSSVMASTGLTITVADTFRHGDNISFSYTITTDSPRYEPIWYSPGIYCQYTHGPEMKVAVISANMPLQEIYTFGSVDDTVIAEQCSAVLFVINKETSRIEQRITKPFTIENTPTIPLEVTLCSDPTCSDTQSSAFVKGQEVYVGYTTRPRIPFEEMDVAPVQQIIDAVKGAIITYPGGNTSNVTLPYLFTAEVSGPYHVELIVDKKSRYLSSTTQFGVMDAKATIMPDEKVLQKQEQFLINLKYLEDLRSGITPLKPKPQLDYSK